MKPTRRNIFPAAALLPALLLCLAAGATAQDKLVGEALGASAGMALYNTLTLTSVAADMLGKNVYRDEQILILLQEQKKFMALIDSYMTRLAGQPTQSSVGDARLSGISTAAKQMSLMIDALAASVKAPSKAKADAYAAKRRTAAAALQMLLGT